MCFQVRSFEKCFVFLRKSTERFLDTLKHSENVWSIQKCFVKIIQILHSVLRSFSSLKRFWTLPKIFHTAQACVAIFRKDFSYSKIFSIEKYFEALNKASKMYCGAQECFEDLQNAARTSKKLCKHRDTQKFLLEASHSTNVCLKSSKCFLELASVVMCYVMFQNFLKVIHSAPKLLNMLRKAQGRFGMLPKSLKCSKMLRYSYIYFVTLANAT